MGQQDTVKTVNDYIITDLFCTELLRGSSTDIYVLKDRTRHYGDVDIFSQV